MKAWSQDNSWGIQAILNKSFEFNPPYQRSDNAWIKEQQNGLINSILQGFPIPPVYLIERGTNTYIVVDGKQRLTTIINFFKKDSKKHIISDIDLPAFKPLESLYFSDDYLSFIYLGKFFVINKSDNSVYHSTDIICCNNRPNLYQLVSFFTTIKKYLDSHDDSDITYLAGRLQLILNNIESFKIHTYIGGNDCTDDDELVVFRYLNAGSALTIFEKYNSLYSDYKLWDKAKTFSRQISPGMRDIIYTGFVCSNRYEDYKFWADIFLSIFKSDDKNIQVYDWKDVSLNGNSIAKTDTLCPEKIQTAQLVLPYFVTCCEGITKTKRTSKILMALFLLMFYRQEQHHDCVNFFSKSGMNYSNIINYINKTALSRKTTLTIYTDLLRRI